MKKITETTNNQPMAENRKETYVKPESQVIEIELEQPILSGSSEADKYTPGGGWEF